MQSQADVVIIGSGFGAAVAALRFSEAGKKVIVLERGGWITREGFEADDEMLWQPGKGRYGMNELKRRGRHIIPWLGTGVGGGSHVYAATLKRRDFFDDFPVDITPEEMQPYYELGEQMMQAVRYPDYPPYDQLPSYRLFREAEQKMASAYPDLVEKQGDVLLAVSFAPPGGEPGAAFTNKYGAKQRYSNPEEQKILGGEIDVKNTLDKNYLFLAQENGAEIRTFCEATKIIPLQDGGYQVEWENPRADSQASGNLRCDILVCGAGAIGSTQLLMQNKELYRTLPDLSAALGKTYFSNGDHVTFLVPKKGLSLSWAGVAAMIAGSIMSNRTVAVAGLAAYLTGWFRGHRNTRPDAGTTNSDYIRFRHRDGTPQGAYIEGGRYPTPIKAVSAIVHSLAGDYEPADYATISRKVNWAGRYVPFVELLERTWPVPVLMMGRDDAVGSYHLNESGEAEINYPFEQNQAYIAYLNKLGRLLASQVDCHFVPNFVAETLKLIEVPHNLGGVPMGPDSSSGVVDSYGRVYGYDNLLVLDGSIMPGSLGPNPVGTILAFSERAMEKVTDQLNREGVISAR